MYVFVSLHDVFVSLEQAHTYHTCICIFIYVLHDTYMYMYLIYMYMHIYNIQIHVSVCKYVIRTWGPHAVNTASRCKHLVIFVLLRFCFMREGTQGFRVPPIVNPLNNGFLKSYDANHLIKHLKKKSPGRAPTIFFFKVSMQITS